MLKTGLIAGGELWERVRSLESLDPDALDEIVFACARTKLGVVAADERDAGRRAALNLGHTVGHAIEAATGYERYRHGEAIGLGPAGRARALRRGRAARRGRGARSSATGCRPGSTRRSGVDEIVEAIGRDKKRTSEGLGFVLCPRPGEVLTDQRVEPSALRAAVERLR